MFGELSPWHLLILAAVFVVLFGSRKLPDAARSLGKSMRIFKAETKALRDDDDSDAARQAQVQQQTLSQQAVQPVAPSPQPMPQPQPGSVTVTLDDGTIVSGVPLAEAQRNQQST